MWTPSKSDDLNPGATSTKRSQHESGLLWVRNCLSGPKPGICREIIQECYEIIQNQMGSNSILKKRVCVSENLGGIPKIPWLITMFPMKITIFSRCFIPTEPHSPVMALGNRASAPQCHPQRVERCLPRRRSHQGPASCDWWTSWPARINMLS